MELISREQAIETFKDCAVNGVGIDGIVDALEQLPPIQPESHWIPCSERLPNKEGEYLVTDVAGGVKTVEVDMLLHYEDDGKPFWCYSQNPIAWCEKPEPYKEVTT